MTRILNYRTSIYVELSEIECLDPGDPENYPFIYGVDDTENNPSWHKALDKFFKRVGL